MARTEARRDRSIADQMRDLLVRCEQRHLEIAERGRKPQEMAVTSREVRETLKVLGQITGELDERTRVNILVTQQQEREAGAVSDLRRLTRLELARLLAKAQCADDAAPAALPALTTQRPKQ
jgi:hypothetical protein